MPFIRHGRVSFHGEDSHFDRRKYVSVLPAKPARKPVCSCEGSGCAGFEGVDEEHDFGPILCHGAYTMNGCSTKESVREFARTALREDLAKAAHLPNCLYNFHPGSHLK